MTDKRWKDHAAFLGELADRVAWLMIAQGADKTEAVNEYTRWLSEACFCHAEGHCREDFDNGFYVPGQPIDEPEITVGGTLVDGISVSGDRVKREASNIGSSWDEAKREPYVYSDAEGDDKDGSVIVTQEECARRFSHCDLCD